MFCLLGMNNFNRPQLARANGHHPTKHHSFFVQQLSARMDVGTLSEYPFSVQYYEVDI